MTQSDRGPLAEKLDQIADLLLKARKLADAMADHDLLVVIDAALAAIGFRLGQDQASIVKH